MQQYSNFNLSNWLYKFVSHLFYSRRLLLLTSSVFIKSYYMPRYFFQIQLSYLSIKFYFGYFFRGDMFELTS